MSEHKQSNLERALAFVTIVPASQIMREAQDEFERICNTPEEALKGERPVTQEHVNKLVLIASGVARMHFDVGGDAQQCPFCDHLTFDYSDIEHPETCPYAVAKALMDELYPEEGKQ